MLFKIFHKHLYKLIFHEISIEIFDLCVFSFLLHSEFKHKTNGHKLLNYFKMRPPNRAFRLS